MKFALVLAVSATTVFGGVIPSRSFNSSTNATSSVTTTSTSVSAPTPVLSDDTAVNVTLTDIGDVLVERKSEDDDDNDLLARGTSGTKATAGSGSGTKTVGTGGSKTTAGSGTKSTANSGTKTTGSSGTKTTSNSRTTSISKPSSGSTPRTTSVSGVPVLSSSRGVWYAGGYSSPYFMTTTPYVRPGFYYPWYVYTDSWAWPHPWYGYGPGSPMCYYGYDHSQSNGKTWTFHNATTNADQTIAVGCVCVPNQDCSCDDNYDQDYVSWIMGNGTWNGYNHDVATIAFINGTETVVVNGTVPVDAPNITSLGLKSVGAPSKGALIAVVIGFVVFLV